jgi:ATP phosphoribosyltransferase regulatory subunit
LWVPFGTARKAVRDYQSEGWIVVAGLEPGEKGPEESRRLRCGHYLAAGGKIEISSAPSGKVKS